MEPAVGDPILARNHPPGGLRHVMVRPWENDALIHEAPRHRRLPDTWRLGTQPITVARWSDGSPGPSPGPA